MCKGAMVITLMEVSGWKGPTLTGKKLDDVNKNRECMEERRRVRTAESLHYEKIEKKHHD